MTIYYVNPYTGSNSNDGLSWGTAWRLLSGDKTIAPGDTVRFAETQRKTTTTNYVSSYNQAAESVAATSSVVFPTTYVKGASMPAGVTTVSYGFSCAIGTVIPPSSKIAYAAVTASPNTATFSRLVTNAMVGYYVPESYAGEYLVIKLCSDATGDVPVATMVAPIYGGFSGTYFTQFSVDTGSASPLNLGTIGSIAFYSVGGWTVGSFAAATNMVQSYIRSTATRSSVDCLTDKVSYRLPPSTLNGWSLPAEMFAIGRTYGASGLSGQMTGNVAWPGYTIGGYSVTPAPLVYYEPLPTTPLERNNAALLTFVGTAGSRITLSGGWNTSTGLQTGYTCITSPEPTPYRPGFTFATESSYTTAERFICMDGPVLNFRKAGNLSIASLWFTDCIALCMFSSAAVAYTAYVGDFLGTRCVSQGYTGMLSLGTTGIVDSPTGIVTVGTMKWVDSVVTKSGVPTCFIQTLYEISSSVPGEMRSFFAAGEALSTYLYTTVNSTGAVRLVDTAIGAYIDKFIAYTDNSTTTSPTLYLDNIRFHTTGNGVQRLSINNWKSVHIGKLTLHPGGASEDFLEVMNSYQPDSYLAVLPTLTITGPIVFTDVNTVAYLLRANGLFSINVPSVECSPPVGGNYPSMHLSSFGMATIGPSNWVHLIADPQNPTFITAGVDGGPNVLTGVNALMDLLGHAGAFVLIGCTLRGTESDVNSLWHAPRISGSSNPNSGQSSISGILGYGCTLSPTFGVSATHHNSPATTFNASSYTRYFQLHGSTYILLSNGASNGGDVYVQYADDYTGTAYTFTNTVEYTPITAQYSDTKFAQQDGTRGYMYTTGSIGPSGQPVISINGCVHFATVYGIVGSPVTVSLVAYGSGFQPFALIVPPCATYIGGIEEHIMLRTVQDYINTAITFTIMPKEEGPLDIHLHSESCTLMAYSISQ